MALYTVSVILLCVSGAIGERPGCPEVCKCPENPPCRPGTSRVLDTCGCGCEVCIQDLDDECDGLHPCDPSKNLTCAYQGDRQLGLCKVIQERRSCSQNGNEILHGQEFRVACDSYCKCEDGNIECEPLCPESPPPVISHCNNVQSVTVPGECCKQWRCIDKPSRFQEWKIHQSPDMKPTAQSVSVDAGAKIRRRREEPDSDTDKDTPLCKPVTDWTPCSRSCGFGSSLRIIYDRENNSSKPERRLCMIRPCKGQYRSANYTVLKSSNVCNHVIRWTQPLHLRYRDCLSSHPILPKFCGHCSDGRFCSPSKSETRMVAFRCAHLKKAITHRVMWVTRCQCGGKQGKRKGGGKKAEERGLQSGEETAEHMEEDN